MISDLVSNSQSTISVSQFYKIWDSQFEHVRIPPVSHDNIIHAFMYLCEQSKLIHVINKQYTGTLYCVTNINTHCCYMYAL